MRFLQLIALLALTLAWSNCKKADAKGDVSFAKSTFESLARGDASTEKNIDWQTFNSLGINVGAQYITLKTEEDKLQFRNGFITQFSSSFRESGGSVESFSNWRVTSHNDTHTEVVADSAGGLLMLTVSERDSKERLSAIKIMK
ncbi:MAG: hypothetical protein H7Y36_03100 [Armatimonadetes bacterium]|nr:hypothetical protein [Akkermansiaceae bacterium]